MVLPIFLTMTSSAEGHAFHQHAASTQAGLGVSATLAHGVGYLIATAIAAWIVVERLGLGLLRKAWINLDLVWAAALIITGSLTVIL
jgi:hypothetical protein